MSSQMNRMSVVFPRRNGRWVFTPLAFVSASALTLATAGAALAQIPPPAPAAPPLNYTLDVSASGIKGSQGVLKTEIDTDGPMQRYDTTVKLANGNTFHVVNLLDCTAGTVTTFDPALKIYTVNQSTQVRPEVLGIGTLLPSYSPDGRGIVFPVPDLRIAAQTGAVGVSVGVTDKGMASIGKTKNAHHSTISLVYSTSGGAAVPYAAQLFDIWTDDTQKQSTNCIAGRFIQAAATGKGAAVGGVTYTFTGDIDPLFAAMTSVPVQISYDSGGAAGTITYTLDKVSTKALDAKLFAAPDSKMRQVAASDFSTEENSALAARAHSDNGGYNDTSAGMRTTSPTTDPYSQGTGVPPGGVLGGG